MFSGIDVLHCLAAQTPVSSCVACPFQRETDLFPVWPLCRVWSFRVPPHRRSTSHHLCMGHRRAVQGHGPRLPGELYIQFSFAKYCIYLILIQVTNVQEVWHYERFTQFDPATMTGGLFPGYIDKFLRLKQQADGWPRENMTAQKKDDYIDAYLEAESTFIYFQVSNCLFYNFSRLRRPLEQGRGGEERREPSSGQAHAQYLLEESEWPLIHFKMFQVFIRFGSLICADSSPVRTPKCRLVLPI